MLTHFWHGRMDCKHSAAWDRSRKRQARRLCMEPLEERCLLSTDVIILWNQAVLNAIRADKPTIGFLTRDLAIVHTAPLARRVAPHRRFPRIPDPREHPAKAQVSLVVGAEDVVI